MGVNDPEGGRKKSYSSRNGNVTEGNKAARLCNGVKVRAVADTECGKRTSFREKRAAVVRCFIKKK